MLPWEVRRPALLAESLMPPPPLPHQGRGAVALMLGPLTEQGTKGPTSQVSSRGGLGRVRKRYSLPPVVGSTVPSVQGTSRGSVCVYLSSSPSLLPSGTYLVLGLHSELAAPDLHLGAPITASARHGPHWHSSQYPVPHRFRPFYPKPLISSWKRE